jgi:flagellar hook-length control protein FliK
MQSGQPDFTAQEARPMGASLPAVSLPTVTKIGSQSAAIPASAAAARSELSWAAIQNLRTNSSPSSVLSLDPDAAAPSFPKGTAAGQTNPADYTNTLSPDFAPTKISNSDANPATLPIVAANSFQKSISAPLQAAAPADADLFASQSNAQAIPNVLPNSSPEPPQVSSAPAQVSDSAATLSSAPLPQDWPTASNWLSAGQLQENPAAPSANSQTSAATGSNAANGKPAQTAHADISFLNLLTPNAPLAPPAAPAKIPFPVPAQPAANSLAPSNLQSPAAAPPSLTETVEHSAAKSAAIGAATFKLHGNLQPPTANSASAASTGALPDKTQSPSQAQDSSNGSSANDSSSKSDHPSNAPANHADDKPFVQTLDTAAVSPMNGHPGATDGASAAATVAAATPVPATPANSAPQTAAPPNADSRATNSQLPDASQNQAVVSAAHMVQQSGQTEIRIEMQADSLGGVELRAHIAGDQIGASIAVEHHDVQMALASDLPSLHSALAEKNLRLETLSVSQGNFSSLSGGPGQDSGQRGFPQNPAKFAYLEQPETAQPAAEQPAEWNGPANPRAGLSVVA